MPTPEEIVTAFDQAMQERDQRTAANVALATADATIRALDKAGLLRHTPATSATVRRVLRDASGQIDTILETVEQIEVETAAPAATEQP